MIYNCWKKKAWLNEILIELYVSLHIQNNNTLVIPNTTAKNLLVNGVFEQNGKPYISAECVSKYRYIVGPVLVNNNHWNCFFVDLETADFVFLDPKLDKADNELPAFDNWKRFYGSIDQNKEWSILRIENITRQKDLDSYNCGVYILQYLKRLINSNFNLCFVSKNTLAQLDNVRVDMLNEFKARIFN
jgi:hypothetical protein